MKLSTSFWRAVLNVLCVWTVWPVFIACCEVVEYEMKQQLGLTRLKQEVTEVCTPKKTKLR